MKKLKLFFKISVNNLYPSKKILVHKKSITKTESIAENFNKYCTQIGSNLAKDIGTSTKSFNVLMVH